MKFFTLFAACLFFIFLLNEQASFAQVSFINANAQVSLTSTHSGCPTAVVDVNGDGLDDIVRLDEGHLLYIDYQRPNQQFDHYFIGDFGYDSGWAWALCVADVDHNGYKDVLAGGYGPSVKIMKLNSTGTSGTLYNLDTSNFFLQNTNFMDVNNDGWEDIFGCDDNSESHIWLNNGDGNFTVSHIIDFDVTNTDDSGNYGSVWSDFDNDGDVDLYIAKCRQGVNDPSDGRRIDVLFVNDGNNNYTSNAQEYNLNDSAETWTCNFADIDNDGDLDCIQVESDVPSLLKENDGTGHMTDITAGSGFDLNIYPIESVMEDFDNDGFVDILVTGSDYQFFHNNGNHTFTKLAGVFGTQNMESFAIGDLNHDGKIDVYASYAGIYTSPSNTDDVYWLNTTGNGNHFVTMNLIGTQSNTGALGARAEIYGAWGVQVREVHAGESYGTCNTANLHFGLGTYNEIDSIVVKWPSGSVTSILHPSADQFITVKENDCVSPDLTISLSGAPVLCNGSSLTLTASALPADYSYEWSTGATTQSIIVSATGSYLVTVSSTSNACYSTSAAINVVENPDETPVITVSGEPVFCTGGSVTLSGPAALGYQWSNGATSQSLTITESGTYTLTTTGYCQDWVSAPVEIIVLASDAPVSSDVFLSEPGTTTLSATGNSIEWYDVPTGGSPLATGFTLTTPYLEDTTVYFAENETSYDGDTAFTGQTYHEGSLYSASNSTNSQILFDVLNTCVLKSVKVYTDIPGPRLIELRGSNGNVLQSALIDIPMDSNRITLNFEIEPGSYQLGTNTQQNQAHLGTNSPHLERSDEGVNYPYLVDSVVSLNGSDQGSGFYYYFYDWEVELMPAVCSSVRTPVTVYVENFDGINAAPQTADIHIFPNPTEGLVTLSAPNGIAGSMNIQLTDMTGRIVFEEDKNGITIGENIPLDLHGFARGVYFMNVNAGSDTKRIKLVIQ
jgi:hypothetical protein